MDDYIVSPVRIRPMAKAKLKTRFAEPACIQRWAGK
jgi:hypothetical protein